MRSGRREYDSRYSILDCPRRIDGVPPTVESFSRAARIALQRAVTVFHGPSCVFRWSYFIQLESIGQSIFHAKRTYG